MMLPDSQRIIRKLPPDEESRLEKLAILAELERDEWPARLERMEHAAAEPGECGERRRKIRATRIPLTKLASAAGTTANELADFLEGLAPLSSLIYERLDQYLESMKTTVP